MDELFNRAVELVLKHEGGYSSDKVDPGGETRFGICHRSHPDVNIKDLTEDQAKQIYKNEYWDKYHFGSLKGDVDMVVKCFDIAVNVGPTRAIEWFHQCNNLEDFLRMARAYYVSLVASKPTMKKFLKGWLNRLGDLG